MLLLWQKFAFPYLHLPSISRSKCSKRELWALCECEEKKTAEKGEKEWESKVGGGGGGGGRQVALCFPTRALWYIFNTNAYSERTLFPNKTMCEVKLFIDLHKKHFLDQINGFVAYMWDLGCEQGVSVSQMERVETTKSNHHTVGR